MGSLLEEIVGEAVGDGYDRLPESVKGYHTHKEWLWLSDRQKLDLVVTECEPAVYEE